MEAIIGDAARPLRRELRRAGVTLVIARGLLRSNGADGDERAPIDELGVSTMTFGAALNVEIAWSICSHGTVLRQQDHALAVEIPDRDLLARCQPMLRRDERSRVPERRAILHAPAWPE